MPQITNDKTDWTSTIMTSDEYSAAMDRLLINMPQVIATFVREESEYYMRTHLAGHRDALDFAARLMVRMAQVTDHVVDLQREVDYLG